MKTEIGGTFKWSTDQISAYAAAFREGDAVRVDGKWVQVSKRKSDGIHYAVDGLNPFLLNYQQEGELAIGISHGFSESRVTTPCKIVTPKDYEVQEGDKLVWLGESDDSRAFGLSYIAAPKRSYFNYKDDNERECIVLAKDVQRWGVVPRYENTKKEAGGEVVLVNQVEYSGKFRVGDRVRHASVVFEDEQKYLGESGTVVEINASQEPLPHIVKFDTGVLEGFNEAELDLIESESIKKEEKEMTKDVECEVKFKVGDVVRVTDYDGSLDKFDKDYVGRHGVVTIADGLSEELPYAVKFETRDNLVWFEGSVLELVREEKSVEQEAFDYLLSQSKDETRNMLEREVALWAEVNLAHRKHDDLRRAINILEKLEKGE